MLATTLPKVFVFDGNNVARWQQCCQMKWQQRCLLATTPSVGNNVAILGLFFLALHCNITISQD